MVTYGHWPWLPGWAGRARKSEWPPSNGPASQDFHNVIQISKRSIILVNKSATHNFVYKSQIPCHIFDTCLPPKDSHT